ncbi:MAG TPA: DUF4153 domain-containing protein [Sphingomicrobium sp.]|nr:DUF4153 domain-containing protein [Sphingomicrobium sp.]
MSERLDERTDAWPLRPWIMAGICALAGLIFHSLVDYHYDDPPITPWRQAGATFVAIAAVSFVMTVEKRRWLWAVAFALGWGLVIALVGWFTAGYNVDATIFEWPYLSGLFAVLLAAPLFQTVRDEGRWQFPYGRLHSHAWNDAVIGAASLFFVGITFLMAWLIASLFDLIGIDGIKKLLQKDWFGWILAGFAFGGAVGLLRERDRLTATLQRLVMVIFSVLAPVLAVALVLFLGSIPFTGLGKLWDSWVPATPMLLVAAAGAILLANAVIGDGREDRARSRLLRWSALALVAVVLPLAGIAALSMSIRITEYGWTPERMWGVIAVAIALAYGLAGWWSIWRGRQDFDDPLRPEQTRLAIGVCALALFLALPILDFGAISARSQLQRLESGKVTPAEFDWAAMAFDFGPSGRARLEQVARTAAPEVRTMAQTALKTTNRWDVRQEELVAGPPPTELTVFPQGATVPDDLRQLLLQGTKGERAFCAGGGACRVYPQADGATFAVIMDGCANLPADQRADPKINCSRDPAVFVREDGAWANAYDRDYSALALRPTNEAASLKQELDAIERGDVKVVPVEKRQLVIGGKPSGRVF